MPDTQQPQPQPQPQPQFTPNGIEIRAGQHMRLEKSVEVTVSDPEGWDLGGIHYDKGDKVTIAAKELEKAKKAYPGKFQGANPKKTDETEPDKKHSVQVQAVTNGTKGVHSNAGAFTADMLGAKVSGGKVKGAPAVVVVESWESENQITVSQALDAGTPTLSVETL